MNEPNIADIAFEPNEPNDLSVVEIDKELECTICHDLLVSPVTLMCQHTFCRLCIKSYVRNHSKPSIDDGGYETYVPHKDKNAKCPLCRCAIVIPPNDNFLLKGLIQTKYPEVYQNRLSDFKKDMLKLDIRDQIEEEIRSEVFNGVVDDAVHENFVDNPGSNRQIDSPSPYVDISTSTHWINKVFSSQSSFTIAWGLLLIALIAVMVKLGVSIKTYIGVCIVMWGVYVYLINKF